MPPKTRRRTPTAENGSPLSPTADNLSRSQIPSGNPTSPLGMSSQTFKRQPTENPIYTKVQSLSKEDQIFLTHDFQKVMNKPTKLQYYNVIRLFNPQTKSKPGDLKEELPNTFMTEVRPLLKPYLFPPPTLSMDTNQQPDFDPLGRKTTRTQLVNAILHKNPNATIPTAANIDDVLILYKNYVDPQLALRVNDRFIKRPRVVSIEQLKKESMEDIVLALRYYSPKVFVRSLAMNKDTLMDLYIRFVRDEEPRAPLIRGFHYTIIELSASDIGDSTDSEAKMDVK